MLLLLGGVDIVLNEELGVVLDPCLIGAAEAKALRQEGKLAVDRPGIFEADEHGLAAGAGLFQHSLGHTGRFLCPPGVLLSESAD